MKTKTIILSTLCILFTVALSAQSEDTRENFEIGVRAGTNYSNVWDSDGEEFKADPKLGLAGGLFLSIPIGKMIGFQPEVLFSQKGFKGSGSLLGFPYSFKRTTNYVDIPLQFQIKPAPFMTILAGPQFSYLISQKDEYTFGSNSTEQEQEFDNDNIRKNTLGFLAGADFSYQNFVLSGRIGWDFQNNKGDGTSQTPRYKNQWLQFTIGFKM